MMSVECNPISADKVDYKKGQNEFFTISGMHMQVAYVHLPNNCLLSTLASQAFQMKLN